MTQAPPFSSAQQLIPVKLSELLGPTGWHRNMLPCFWHVALTFCSLISCCSCCVFAADDVCYWLLLLLLHPFAGLHHCVQIVTGDSIVAGSRAIGQRLLGKLKTQVLLSSNVSSVLVCHNVQGCKELLQQSQSWSEDCNM